MLTIEAFHQTGKAKLGISKLARAHIQDGSPVKPRVLWIIFALSVADLGFEVPGSLRAVLCKSICTGIVGVFVAIEQRALVPTYVSSAYMESTSPSSGNLINMHHSKAVHLRLTT